MSMLYIYMCNLFITVCVLYSTKLVARPRQLGDSEDLLSVTNVWCRQSGGALLAQEAGKLA